MDVKLKENADLIYNKILDLLKNDFNITECSDDESKITFMCGKYEVSLSELQSGECSVHIYKEDDDMHCSITGGQFSEIKKILKPSADVKAKIMNFFEWVKYDDGSK